MFGKEIHKAAVDDPKPIGIKLYEVEEWRHEIETRISFRKFASYISEFFPEICTL